MRRKLVIANRKMHGSIPENKDFLEKLLEGTQDLNMADYVACMPHPYHFQAQAMLTGTHLHWGGQTMSRFASGAHTGSISPYMLLEFGCTYVIMGHSERRMAGYESDTASGQRFEEALRVGLTPVLCMGETLNEYEMGLTASVTTRQLTAVIDQVGVQNLAKGVLAYEPIWAIGTGKAASPEHAQIILRFLREHIAVRDPEVAKNIRILYGGSVNAANAARLFAMPDIDGGLVGKASLDTAEFIEICRAAHNATAAIAQREAEAASAATAAK
jgi:triosephosphate isomerase (TIM)